MYLRKVGCFDYTSIILPDSINYSPAWQMSVPVAMKHASKWQNHSISRSFQRCGRHFPLQIARVSLTTIVSSNDRMSISIPS